MFREFHGLGLLVKVLSMKFWVHTIDDQWWCQAVHKSFLHEILISY